MLEALLGKKLGMTQIFQPNGEMIGVTVLEVGPCAVLEKVVYPHKTAIRIGYGSIKEKNLSKPVQGYFKKLNSPLFRIIKEVPLEKGVVPESLSGNSRLGVELFEKNEFVDVSGLSKGRGFQGGMKRYGWHGQPRTHGHTSHRRIGSNGANTDPGRVVRGHRMPGHYGNAQITVRNLEVIRTDKEHNLLFVRGAVPGAANGIVLIRKPKVYKRKKIHVEQTPIEAKKTKEPKKVEKKAEKK
jgi:large subunit ribosomal protein L3